MLAGAFKAANRKNSRLQQALEAAEGKSARLQQALEAAQGKSAQLQQALQAAEGKSARLQQALEAATLRERQASQTAAAATKAASQSQKLLAKHQLANARLEQRVADLQGEVEAALRSGAQQVTQKVASALQGELLLQAPLDRIMQPLDWHALALAAVACDRADSVMSRAGARELVIALSALESETLDEVTASDARNKAAHLTCLASPDAPAFVRHATQLAAGHLHTAAALLQGT